ncbi:phenylalanine--tRNA ligase beta subunit-related protein [Catenulispora yoronensis]|uniref:Phenylalanine--tRNA ligase beta subunit-related protein n=1 Tax=Catenulispora yoronensis TaxID=450799 RepID=A0ABP5G550_9ACTN
MYFQHAEDVWSEYPELVAAAITTSGITPTADVDARVAQFVGAAKARLADGTESDLPEIKAWRQTFTKMGLKPTQYRCASEALLRRLRKEGDLPRIHPLIDLCNAVSVAYAIPVGVFDLDEVAGFLEVRHAAGDEDYLTFAGTSENPEPRELIFADAEGRAHARRWTNRQSGRSAVRESTSRVLIVSEAMHASAAEDVASLMKTLADAVAEAWQVNTDSTILTSVERRFTISA